MWGFLRGSVIGSEAASAAAISGVSEGEPAIINSHYGYQTKFAALSSRLGKARKKSYCDWFFVLSSGMSGN